MRNLKWIAVAVAILGLAVGVLAMPRTAKHQTICNWQAVEVTCETPLSLKGQEFIWRKTVERSGDDIQVSGKTCTATVDFGRLKVTAYEFATYFFCLNPNAGAVMGRKDGRLHVFEFQSLKQKSQIDKALRLYGIETASVWLNAKTYPSTDYEKVYARMFNPSTCAVGK